MIIVKTYVTDKNFCAVPRAERGVFMILTEYKIGNKIFSIDEYFRPYSRDFYLEIEPAHNRLGEMIRIKRFSKILLAKYIKHAEKTTRMIYQRVDENDI